jgi:hypothetical protein
LRSAVVKCILSVGQQAHNGNSGSIDQNGKSDSQKPEGSKTTCSESLQLEEFLRLGDLRPGSITAVTRRCGKPSCHCAKHNDPGHDPQFRLTRRVSGKTVTETFPNPTALRKAQQQVAEFHRFQKLSQDLVALNDRICRLRPVAQERGGWTEQEKKRLLRSIRKWPGK